ncbi:hypothetical protein P7K49_008615 [Saguinus oedipus]|uniref:t-SNARE coiled-coil homology domain-containing protein n=1 Tax=Saguinus oedipus TaxID=9490 RepID=A0ABQ9VY92_SAGOE|nr:hypothetical protein P7K49_008615 [Saguinus oedipus]
MNSIEANVENAEVHVQQANQQLSRAADYQRSLQRKSRKTLCIIILILVIGVVIIDSCGQNQTALGQNGRGREENSHKRTSTEVHAHPPGLLECGLYLKCTEAYEVSETTDLSDDLCVMAPKRSRSLGGSYWIQSLGILIIRTDIYRVCIELLPQIVRRALDRKVRAKENLESVFHQNTLKAKTGFNPSKMQAFAFLITCIAKNLMVKGSQIKAGPSKWMKIPSEGKEASETQVTLCSDQVLGLEKMNDQTNSPYDYKGQECASEK